jgi:transposase
MDIVVGLDVSKDTLEVALLRVTAVLRATMDNTPEGHRKLLTWLAKHHRKIAVGQVHACLEATGNYSDEVALRLHTAGYVVSVVNPARIKAFGDSRLSRTQTDAADAWLIAEFCRTQTPPAWSPPAPEVLTLRRLGRHLEDLQSMRQQEVNRLRRFTSGWRHISPSWMGKSPPSGRTFTTTSIIIPTSSASATCSTVFRGLALSVPVCCWQNCPT